MASNYSLKYNVDIVMCIDATGSMNGILDTVKSNALNFYGDLINSMRKKGKQVNDMRIKVIAFRDYVADGENAMLATDFFRMPEEQEEFRDLVNTISACGGGDEPEDGLEALAYAIRTDWTRDGDKRRHVIVVWTDAPRARLRQQIQILSPQHGGELQPADRLVGSDGRPGETAADLRSGSRILDNDLRQLG